jgi:hypothetical protein
MTSKFIDLTTPEGRDDVLELLCPALPLFRKALDAFKTYVVDSTQAQKQAAVDIIRAGRDSGVESMTIKMERTAGIDLGVSVDDIPLKMKVGDSGTVEIFVKYK